MTTDIGIAQPADDEARHRVGRLRAEHALEHRAQRAALGGVERPERRADGVGPGGQRRVGGAVARRGEPQRDGAAVNARRSLLAFPTISRPFSTWQSSLIRAFKRTLRSTLPPPHTAHRARIFHPFFMGQAVAGATGQPLRIMTPAALRTTPSTAGAGSPVMSGVPSETR